MSSERNDFWKDHLSKTEDLILGEKIPSLYEVALAIRGESDESSDAFKPLMDRIGDGEYEEALGILSNKRVSVSTEDSTKYMEKVMASNHTEIAQVGYLYKKLMTSADRLFKVDGDCGSDGVVSPTSKISEEIYNFRIKWSYAEVSEDGKSWERLDTNLDYSDLPEGFFVPGASIRYRTPLTCKRILDSEVCSVCIHGVPDEVKRVGLYAALMVTEHSTQSALSSMNNGIKTTGSRMLETTLSAAPWSEIQSQVTELVDGLLVEGVFAKYYECLFASRLLELDSVSDSGEPMVELPSITTAYFSHGQLIGGFLWKSVQTSLHKLLTVRELDDKTFKLLFALGHRYYKE